MENLSKALLIAGGMLIAGLLITLLFIGYQKFSSYYELKSDSNITEQLEKFNKQFINYSGRTIRGNELISLMNKVIDYNSSESYQIEKGYKPIIVHILIGNENINEFKYEINGDRYGNKNTNLNIDSSGYITNVGGGGSADWQSDKNLVAITNTPTTLIKLAKDNGINNLTDTQLQKLTMEVSSILLKDSDETKVANQQNEDRRIRAIVLRDILKFKIGQVGKTNPGDTYDLILDNYYRATTRTK